MYVGDEEGWARGVEGTTSGRSTAAASYEGLLLPWLAVFSRAGGREVIGGTITRLEGGSVEGWAR